MSAATPPLPIPAEKHTERSMLDLLHQRYGDVYAGARRYAVAEHVRDNSQFGTCSARVVDLIAADAYGATGYAIHGHEIKVSRSDLLAELKTPDKARAFSRYMDFWWLVVPYVDMVKPGELPDDWGVLVTHPDGKLRAARQATRLTPEPMPRALLATLLRAASKTAAARAISVAALQLGEQP